MKRTMLALLAFVVLTTLVSLAQEPANQDNTKQPATQEKQDHKPTSPTKTVTGCVQKGQEAGEFSITGEDGKTWELSSKSVKLDEHVGLNVMSGAPFGYRYVSVPEGGGQARFEPVAEQARVVQQIFSWIGRDRYSLSEVCRRLQSASELTATGKRIWSREAVWHVLQNPAYMGQAAYGKTPENASRLRRPIIATLLQV